MAGNTQRKKIGDYMIEKALIKREWVPEILEKARTANIRFGEAAVTLGYITEPELQRVLLTPYKNDDYFELDPQAFPTATQDLMPVEQLMRDGVLALGYKKKVYWMKPHLRLDLGLLDMRKRSRIEAEIASRLPEVKEIKVFQLMPDRFIDSLIQVYGETREGLKAMSSVDLDECARLYLQLDLKKRRA